MSPPFDGLQDIRKSKNGKYIGLAIAALVSLLMILYLSTLCFTALLIAFILYYIPKYFGMTDRKKLAVFGTVVVLMLGLAWGLMVANSIATYDGEAVSADKYLVGGVVDPVHGPGDETQNFTFSVTLDTFKWDSNVSLKLINQWGDAEETYYDMSFIGNTTDGAVYERNMTLEKGIYTYGFRYWNGTGFYYTASGSGPYNANNEEVTNLALYNGILFLGFIQIGLFFYMLLVLTYYMDKSRDRMMKEMETAKAKKEAAKKGAEGGDEKFVCSECGADVPADAKNCPQCGESFDDDKEEKCPQCGSVIFPTDTKCWNCGKDLGRDEKK